jgi:hypothetical protein
VTGPATTLTSLCGRIRPELASLGDLGASLVATLGVVERAGAGRTTVALTDPGYAIDVLTSEPGVAPALVRRVLDYLRARGGHSTIAGPGGVPELRLPSVTLADAIASYDAGPLALMAKGTGHTYRTWTRRLAAAHGDDAPRHLTAGDLKDLIAKHVLAARRSDERRRSGRAAEENAIGAFRSLWGYLVEKGWPDENIAMRLTNPPGPSPTGVPVCLAVGLTVTGSRMGRAGSGA